MLFMLKNEGEEQEHPEGLQEAEREQQREEESAGGLAETSGLNLLAYKPLFVLLTPPKATGVVLHVELTGSASSLVLMTSEFSPGPATTLE